MVRFVNFRLLLNLLIAAGIIVLAFVGVVALQKLRTPPARKAETEMSVNAAAVRVASKSVQVNLSGYGTAQAHRRADISAQVSGRVVHVSTVLEEGGWVEAGERVLEIDPADYQSAVNRLQAELQAARAELTSLASEQQNDQSLKALAQRQLELAEREYERYRQLVEIEDVESPQRLDTVEQSVVSQRNQLQQINNRLNLYEVRRQQQQARIEAIEAQLAQARLNVDRTRIEAPFAGRIEGKEVDVGQTVSVNQRLFTLVDDSILEIPVPIEGRDVARWLNIGMASLDQSWFTQLPDTPVQVSWTEWPALNWMGRLVRVARYDENERTIHLVVEVDAPRNRGRFERSLPPQPDSDLANPSFPLVSGMFCQVIIPGREVRNVFRLPEGALEHDGRVLLVEDGRMYTRVVEVVRRQGETVLVRGELSDGDLVLSQRPSRVIEGLKVNPTVALTAEELEQMAIEDQPARDRVTTLTAQMQVPEIEEP